MPTDQNNGDQNNAGQLRVLLVDDTPDVRLLLRTLFADRPNVEVIREASDGEEAIELAAQLHPDLIVLDIAMPILDGISALSSLREASPSARSGGANSSTVPVPGRATRPPHARAQPRVPAR